ncbi:MAG: M20/M25/M40 family metallo-hydrolase [Woeseiaceae bacterium]|nr:M20/M25/M40 family metallo-hydrolase [Woeseiaceae bacterium]
MFKKIFATAALVLASAPAAAGLDENERLMVEWIDAHAEEAIALLEETVNISSGTMNHQGVRDVGVVMRRELDMLGLDTAWIDPPNGIDRAGHLFGYKRSGSGPKFVMIGHLDTVFEADDDFQAFLRNGDIANGPGVADMKGGNVVMVYALKALQEIGALDDIPVIVAYTGDEEKMGRPIAVSRKELIEAGKWADIGLGFESAVTDDGGDWGTIARRSSTSWVLEVDGRQAHSSRVFSENVGAGAIFETSRILNRFYEEVRGEEHLTFNVGTIQGGTDVTYERGRNRGTTFGKTNVVARRAVVHGGIRALSLEQLDRAKQAMQRIVADSLPHTSASISFSDSYPPMFPSAGNREILDMLSDVNVDLGRGPMRELDPSRRGAADVSFVAPYTDAVAGMGTLGKGSHSPHETIYLSSMPVAIKRAAILMYRLSKDNERTD